MPARLRSASGWLGGWIASSAAVLALVVVRTLAQGGRFHRTPVCCGPDANIYAAGFVSGVVGAIIVLAYWALGAPQPRWRWIRLALVAVAAVPLAILAFVAVNMFTYACMCAPPIS